MSQNIDDTFSLYDLRVEVVVPNDDPRRILCGANKGDYFELKGEMISLPDGQGFSMFSLAAVLPLLAAKQRCREKRDWMWTDEFIACPDPNCPTKLKISRTGTRLFRHGDTTVVPLGTIDGRIG
ncbi:hypothetical protein K439DRAFT_1368946 [Ramaria rubella]|nr:hypothetical protein K439DRAFT_1368946 [Ramaria rubella]